MKKRTVHRMTAFFLSIALLLGCGMTGVISVSAAADNTITFDGSKALQISSDNFFGDAGKGLMPGSSFVRTVDIRNQSEDSIIVYLRTEIGDEVYADYVEKHPQAAELSSKAYVEQLIKELTITITALDRQGNPVEVYYQGPASGDPQHKDPSDPSAGTTDREPNSPHGIVIGRLSERGVANLTFKVEVPLSLGNEYQDTMSLVRWHLVCSFDEGEIIIPDPPPLDGPETGGDDTMKFVAIGVGAAAVVCLVLLLLAKKKKDKEEQK